MMVQDVLFMESRSLHGYQVHTDTKVGQMAQGKTARQEDSKQVKQASDPCRHTTLPLHVSTIGTLYRTEYRSIDPYHEPFLEQYTS